MLRQVKMATKGPNRNHKIGGVIEVDDARARRLVKDKDAKYTKAKM